MRTIEEGLKVTTILYLLFIYIGPLTAIFILTYLYAIGGKDDGKLP